MPHSFTTGCLILAFTIFALSNAPAKSQQSVNPQAGGTARQPGPEVLGLLQSQVRATELMGAPVLSPKAHTLGHVADMLLDKQHAAVDVIGVALAKGPGGKVATVPWSALQPAPHSPGKYVTSLSTNALADAPNFADQAKAHPDYVDVEHDLLGRQVASKG